MYAIARRISGRGEGHLDAHAANQPLRAHSPTTPVRIHSYDGVPCHIRLGMALGQECRVWVHFEILGGISTSRRNDQVLTLFVKV